MLTFPSEQPPSKILGPFRPLTLLRPRPVAPFPPSGLDRPLARPHCFVTFIRPRSLDPSPVEAPSAIPPFLPWCTLLCLSCPHYFVPFPVHAPSSPIPVDDAPSTIADDPTPSIVSTLSMVHPHSSCLHRPNLSTLYRPFPRERCTHRTILRSATVAPSLVHAPYSPLPASHHRPFPRELPWFLVPAHTSSSAPQ